MIKVTTEIKCDFCDESDICVQEVNWFSFAAGIIVRSFPIGWSIAGEKISCPKHEISVTEIRS